MLQEALNSINSQKKNPSKLDEKQKFYMPSKYGKIQNFSPFQKTKYQK